MFRYLRFTIPHTPTRRVLTLISACWLRIERNSTGDRILQIISIGATVILGLLGVFASAQTPLAAPLVVMASVLMVLATVTALAARSTSRAALLRLYQFPYKLMSNEITVDIRDDHGGLAVLQTRERVVCRQDHMMTVRRLYWGDWDPMTINDLQCSAPRKAVVADCFVQDGITVYLISLRDNYNNRDEFDLALDLSVRNGFCGDSEMHTNWGIGTDTDFFSLTVVLPPNKCVAPGTLRLRLGYPPRIYKYQQLPDKHLKYREDGRQVITWSCEHPTKHWKYGLYWYWREAG